MSEARLSKDLKRGSGSVSDAPILLYQHVLSAVTSLYAKARAQTPHIRQVLIGYLFGDVVGEWSQ